MLLKLICVCVRACMCVYYCIPQLVTREYPVSWDSSYGHVFYDWWASGRGCDGHSTEATTTTTTAAISTTATTTAAISTTTVTASDTASFSRLKVAIFHGSLSNFENTYFGIKFISSSEKKLFQLLKHIRYKIYQNFHFRAFLIFKLGTARL